MYHCFQQLRDRGIEGKWFGGAFFPQQSRVTGPFDHNDLIKIFNNI
jgi:hypothetical protein